MPGTFTGKPACSGPSIDARPTVRVGLREDDIVYAFHIHAGSLDHGADHGSCEIFDRDRT